MRADLELYADAWAQMHRARACGNGPTGIALAEIAAWMDMAGVTEPWEREAFLDAVQALDAEWLSWARTEAERQAARPGKSS